MGPVSGRQTRPWARFCQGYFFDTVGAKLIILCGSPGGARRRRNDDGAKGVPDVPIHGAVSAVMALALQAADPPDFKNESRREFLQNYMTEFHGFSARVYTALPRNSWSTVPR
jgi:hypothetical protein